MVNPATRIAVVTGGGSGIGAATGLALARAGWTVVIAGRHQESLDEVAGQAGEYADSVTGVATDVTKEDSVAGLFDNVARTRGRLDLLFNNAGISAPPQEIDEMSLGDWNRVVAVNLTGMFLCARAAFGLMRRQTPQGGRIINNGSLSAHVPRPLSIAYTTTKHAVTGMTKSLSLDGRKHQISCGQVDIGNAATHMTQRMQQGVLQADGQLRPEPTMNVQHVADAIVQMAGLPLDATIAELTILATTMPYVGRG